MVNLEKKLVAIIVVYSRAYIVVRYARKSWIWIEPSIKSGDRTYIRFGQIMLSTPLHEICWRVNPPLPLGTVVAGS